MEKGKDVGFFFETQFHFQTKVAVGYSPTWSHSVAFSCGQSIDFKNFQLDGCIGPSIGWECQNVEWGLNFCDIEKLFFPNVLVRLFPPLCIGTFIPWLQFEFFSLLGRYDFPNLSKLYFVRDFFHIENHFSVKSASLTSCEPVLYEKFSVLEGKSTRRPATSGKFCASHFCKEAF